MTSQEVVRNIKEFIHKHPLVVGFSCMALLTIVILWLAMCFLDVWTHHGEEVIVPEIKSMSYDEASKLLQKHGLEIEISDSIYDTSIEPGTIIESWPKAESKIKSGRKVYVTITSFSPRMVTISGPVVGVSSRQAISYLNAMGINGIKIKNVPSEFTDLVEDAYYNNKRIGVGTMLPVDAVVTLEVGIATLREEPDTSDFETDGEFTDADLSDISTESETSAEASIANDLQNSAATYFDDEP